LHKLDEIRVILCTNCLNITYYSSCPCPMQTFMYFFLSSVVSDCNSLSSQRKIIPLFIHVRDAAGCQMYSFGSIFQMKKVVSFFKRLFYTKKTMNKRSETMRKSNCLHRFQNRKEQLNCLHFFYPPTNQRPSYESFPEIRPNP
jgi:hypothetical protein